MKLSVGWLVALTAVLFCYVEPWQTIVHYLLWWMRLLVGWAIGGSVLFALAFQRRSVGVLLVPGCAALWAVAPAWVQWWLEPQECLVAVVLLGCLTAFLAHAFLPTLCCVLLPSALIYWSQYGFSFGGLQAALSLSWLSSHVPGWFSLLLEVLYNVVTCVTCVSLGGTLILPAVLRILHHARRPSRLRHQGWLDGFKGTCGTIILGTICRTATMEAVLQAHVSLMPILMMAFLFLVFRWGSLPRGCRLGSVAASATLLAWWHVNWPSILHFIYASGALCRVLLGLTGDVLLLALWRTDHPEKWPALQLAMGVWAGLVWCGYWPAAAEILRCGWLTLAACWSAAQRPESSSTASITHDLLTIVTVPVVAVSYISWRLQRTLAWSHEAQAPAIVLDFDFSSWDSQNTDDHTPALIQLCSMRDLREDLPGHVRLWKAAREERQTAPPSRLLGPWVLWELLEARSVEDVMLIMNEVARCESKDSPRSLPPVNLHVDRHNFLESAISSLGKLQPLALEAKVIKVTFRGEAGQDYGGLRREFFTHLAQHLADPAACAPTALFATAADQTLLPQPAPPGSPVDAQTWFVVGRFLGLSLMQQCPIPFSLNRLVFKLMVGQPLRLADVRALDPDFFRHRFETLLRPGGIPLVEQWLCEPLTFLSAATPRRPTAVPLREGGAAERVTEANRLEYLRLLAEDYVLGGVEAQLSALLRGFHEVVPLPVLTHLQLGPADLEVLLTGLPVLDVEDWRVHTDVTANTPRKAQVLQWFWDCVAQMDPEQRSRLLVFATGCARLPAGGFAALRCAIGFDDNPDHLPSAHTCSNTLILPLCPSRDALAARLSRLLSAGPAIAIGFGFA
eukprot:EG_transcript_2116